MSFQVILVQYVLAGVGNWVMSRIWKPHHTIMQNYNLAMTVLKRKGKGMLIGWKLIKKLSRNWLWRPSLLSYGERRRVQ